MTGPGNEETMDEEGTEGRSFHPSQAIMPISMMVVLIVVTLSLALFIGPYYTSLGLSSGMGEFAENPLYAFLFLGMMIVVAVGILLLRKLLKRRRFKLKYVLAIAVALATLGVFQPIVDIAVNGAPPVWDEYELEVKDAEIALPLDPEDPGEGLLLVKESSFHVLERRKYHYEEIDDLSGLDEVYHPHFNGDLWLLTGTKDGNITTWTVDAEGKIEKAFSIYAPSGDQELLGANLVYENERYWVLSFWKNETSWDVKISDLRGPYARGITNDIGKDRGPMYPSTGWTDGQIALKANNSVAILSFGTNPNGLELNGSTFINRSGIDWCHSIGSATLVFSDDSGKGVAPSLELLEDDALLPLYKGRVGSGYDVSFAAENGDRDLFVINGDELLYRSDDKDEDLSFTDSITALFRTSPGDDVWVVHSEYVEKGSTDFGERMQFHVTLIAALITMGIMFALLRKPKWWLVDLTGLIMGAGVVALMGITFPVLFTLLLMVLLAVYDAVSVYKTKHMIALADSVVEAKMPVLLVFPMKLSYRYEDETNLMDPKRKRESLFMGLGDVIIPGILIVSAFTFLSPVGRLELFGFVYPPLTVAITTLLGMLLGFSVLMFFVIKGKAHAGLPPLNGGAIAGFIVGHLLVYGNIIFW